MPTPEGIKHFVQNTLGCGCPEEVFSSIDVQERVPLGANFTLPFAMIVGNRLLVYLAYAESPSMMTEFLEFLVRAGTQERDKKKLNRFRLVVVTDDRRTASEAKDLFDRISGKDEKVHLHVIGNRDLF